MLIVVVKGSKLVFFQIWLRWTVPRLRIDQVMVVCLKYLLPISCFLFLGVVLWPIMLLAASGNTTLLSPVGNRAGTEASVTATDAASAAAWVDPNAPIEVNGDEADPEPADEPEEVSAAGADSGDPSVALNEGGRQ